MATWELMGYYDPGRWVAPDDRLIDQIEAVLKVAKMARQTHTTSSKRYLPPWSMELDIVVLDTRETMRLSEWLGTKGRINIRLQTSEQVCRNGHFNHPKPHQNPNGRTVPRHHIHFPTVKYPNLSGRRTYAHKVTPTEGHVAALKKFCELVNIDLQGITIPYIRR